MSGELIVGLDVATRAKAEALVDQLDGIADFFKIGYQLIYGGDGLALGRELIAANKRVFFDLKLHDIDNTVEKGIAGIAQTGAAMVTVHAYPKVMRAAARGAAGSGLRVLGVTVLTAMDQADLDEAGYGMDLQALVQKRINQARDAGIAGVVASPFEAAIAREILGASAAVVTPGIRPSGSDAGDQKRIMTPGAAIEAGASHLVVARPIVTAPDPAAAARSILAQLAEAD